LRIPGFRSLVLAYAINRFGTWLGEIALAVLVYDQTGSALATAALFIAMQFVPALISPAVVARAEVTGTRIVLPLFYVVEAALFAALAVSADNFSLPIVLALVTLDGTLAITANAFVRATAAAVLTPVGLLRQGNAIFNIAMTAAAATGPAVAGLAVAGLGTGRALALDAASFLVAAAALAATRSLPDVKAEASPWRTRLREGLAYVSRRPVLAALLGAQAAAMVFFTAVLPVEIVFAKDTLDAGNAGYGALLTAWGVGMVLGGVAFSAFQHASIRLLLALGTLAIGLAYLGMAVAGTLVVACVAASIGGVGNGVQWISMLNAVQELTAERFQARVVGLLESISSAMPGVGFLIGGALTAAFDPRLTFLLAGVGVLAVLAAASVRLASANWAPEPQGEAGVPARL
jgi:MFS family permease